MRILFLGDVYGEAGLKALNRFMPKIRETYSSDLMFVNGENVSGGIGLKKADYKTLMSHGFHAVTLGNHAFSKSEIFDYIEDANIVRPLNYPRKAPGKGVRIVRYNQTRVALVQLMGRVFMHDPLNNPFEAVDHALESIEADYIVVDVHAETTSEKLALGHYLDGRVDAVVGTHTHVPTNDAMVLPKGTLYMSDLGMCGAKYGILGADRDLVIKKFTTGMPVRLRPEKSDTLQISGALIDFETQRITPFHWKD